MKNLVIAIPSFLITTIVYALLCPIFFEIDNAVGQIENSTDNDNDDNNSKTTDDTQQQQVIETQCKSPCPPNAEMCIEMCA